MAHQKRAFVDYWTLCQNFSRGDIVQTYNHLGGGLEGYPGMVTAVHPGIGFIDVEFPWGNQRMSPEFLVKQNPRFLFNYPSFIDTSYGSWDIDRSHLEDGTEAGYSYANPRKASGGLVDVLARELDQRQKTLRTAACQCKHNGLDEVDAYGAMHNVLQDEYGDSEIRDAVATVFTKHALYWSAPGRRYRMNKGEMDDGLPNCPHCDANMLKTNYKKHTKLFVCPRCLFCIKPGDIEGLPGQIAEEGFGTGEDPDIGEVDIIATALQFARQEMATEIPSLKLDLIKKQAEACVKKHYKTQSKLAEKVAIEVVRRFSAEMDTQENKLPASKLKAEVQSILLPMWKDELKALVSAAFSQASPPFHDQAEQARYAMDFIEGLSDKAFFKVDEKEVERLVTVGREMEAETISRYANGLHRVLAASSPTPIEVRGTLGANGLQRIFDTVTFNARSEAVSNQFESDFKAYGLGDAMFLLGASTADGLFDRTAYNALVDILDHVRSEGR